MSHFSSIGMDINSREDLQGLVAKTLEHGVQEKFKEGIYSKLVIDERVEFWVGEPSGEGRASFNPHFSGEIINKVKITQVIGTPEFPLEGSFYIWINSNDIDNSKQEYPMVFDCPNFAQAVKHLAVNNYYDANITAFAEEVEIYNTDEEFKQGNKSPFPMATHSFIPSGTFVKEGYPPAARAIFTGVINKVRLLNNSVYSKEYYWLNVTSLDADYDVVVDPKIINNKPIVNGVISGNFWMSGKFLLYKDKLKPQSTYTKLKNYFS